MMINEGSSKVRNKIQATTILIGHFEIGILTLRSAISLCALLVLGE